MINISKLFIKNGKPIKFKISNDIKSPRRSQFEQRIMQCGGEVTDSDDNADMKLYDPEKHTSSPNSYSLKFVIDSFFWEKMQDKKKYEIKCSDNKSQPASSSKSIDTILNSIKYVKGSKSAQRIPYTKKDDEILISYVNNSNLPTSGKTLYKNMEREYPQHTWQSWRNRWMRILEPRIKNRKEAIHIKNGNNNDDDKLKKIYETTREINNNNNESDNQDVNLSFEKRKKRVLSAFSHFSDDDFYNENDRKKRKVNSILNELSNDSNTDFDDDNEIENNSHKTTNKIKEKLINTNNNDKNNKSDFIDSINSKEKYTVDENNDSKKILDHVKYNTQSNNKSNDIRESNILSNEKNKDRNNNEKSKESNNIHNIINKNHNKNDKNNCEDSNFINFGYNKILEEDINDDIENSDTNSFPLCSQDMNVYNNLPTHKLNENNKNNNSNNETFYIPLTEISFKINKPTAMFQSNQDIKNAAHDKKEKNDHSFGINNKIEKDFDDFNFENLASQPITNNYEILEKHGDNYTNITNENNTNGSDYNNNENKITGHEHSLSIIPNIIKKAKLKNKTENIFENNDNSKSHFNDLSDLIENSIVFSDDDDDDGTIFHPKIIGNKNQYNVSKIFGEDQKNNINKYEKNESIINKNLKENSELEKNNTFHNSLNENNLSKNSSVSLNDKSKNKGNNDSSDSIINNKQKGMDSNEKQMKDISINDINKNKILNENSKSKQENNINIKSKEDNDNKENNINENQYNQENDSTKSFDSNYSFENNSFPFIDNNLFLSQPSNIQDELF
ncbi:hypothetical protein BCR36DRAFT_409968 [Piromyces finnis]|uniref:DNA-binding protein RAP1 n=1 Tax=Piromyces finnis TaxID=1754191 RepID=A0A1Y1VGR6_9FUNG|nr:hypothetical protein BCR36DRAFT_409968 [Piromyces finnis]|eukprot:ORX55925.1 hypothetical protein BCR36DRAFT_409968 [Piromyces finnis]